LNKYEYCKEADIFISNMSCNLTKKEIIRHLMVLKIVVLGRNKWKELLATSRVLSYAGTKKIK
jgi:hypothetical protein